MSENIILDKKDWDFLIEQLEKEPKPSEQLEKLLKQPLMFEKENNCSGCKALTARLAEYEEDCKVCNGIGFTYGETDKQSQIQAIFPCALCGGSGKSIINKYKDVTARLALATAALEDMAKYKIPQCAALGVHKCNELLELKNKAIEALDAIRGGGA